MKDLTHEHKAHKHLVVNEQVETLKRFAIDFLSVGTMLSKLEKCYATEEALKQSLESLIDLFK